MSLIGFFTKHIEYIYINSFQHPSTFMLSREERRWIDKQNKAARAKLKKEEMARIRQVVDNAYACDPRVEIFKQEDQRRKMEIKEAKRMVQRQRQMEEENVSSLLLSKNHFLSCCCIP